jgi:hypothetical protein
MLNQGHQQQQRRDPANNWKLFGKLLQPNWKLLEPNLKLLGKFLEPNLKLLGEFLEPNLKLLGKLFLTNSAARPAPRPMQHPAPHFEPSDVAPLAKGIGHLYGRHS